MREPLPVIGAVLWDVIARAPTLVARGDDVPGTVVRTPGGVALNLALGLARLGLAPVLLGAVGDDAEGAALAAALTAAGVDAAHLTRLPGAATDRYVAIEDRDGLVAAVADTAALDGAGAIILAPLAGILAAGARTVVADGNLGARVLAALPVVPDLRIVGASPAKSTAWGALPRATLYLNRAEAEALLGRGVPSARAAAEALRAQGTARAIVTDGAAPAADASPAGTVSRVPAHARALRATGAGDAFAAAHIAAELRGTPPEAALALALAAAAAHLEGPSA